MSTLNYCRSVDLCPDQSTLMQSHSVLKAAGIGPSDLQVGKEFAEDIPRCEGHFAYHLLYMRAFAEAHPDEQIAQQRINELSNCDCLMNGKQL